MSSTMTEDKAAAFPLPRECPMHMPGAYRDGLEHEGPSRVRFWNGQEGWLFVRYADVKAILANPQFSAVVTAPNFPSLSPARDAISHNDPTFLRLDPPDHTYYRRMLTGEFMVRRISAMKPGIAAIVDRLLDDMICKGPPGDIVHDFALPLTSQVITDLLGIPYADREFFNEQSRLKAIVAHDASVAIEAQKKTIAYLEGHFAHRLANPEEGDDLIGRLVRDQIIPGHLTVDMAIKTCDLLMMGGHETTANQIALGVMEFVGQPAELAKLRANPDLLPGAIEEMLRLHTIVHLNALRVAKEDIEVNGFLVRKGEGVCAMITGANHDPRKFPDPDRFDITRDTQGHIAFSYGVHQCLGQSLARAELEAVFSVIFDRLPNLRLAEKPDALDYKTESIVMGVESLPVAWDA